MKQLAVMISIPGAGRADVMLTAERVYYRFATTDTVEDGDLPGLRERYQVVEARVLELLSPREGEQAAEGVRADVFVDNVRATPKPLTSQALGRLAAELAVIDDVFVFLQSFV